MGVSRGFPRNGTHPEALALVEARGLEPAILPHRRFALAMLDE